MTPNQADRAFAKMTSIWHTARLEKPAIAAWVQRLADYRADDVDAAIDTLAEQLEHFPSHAIFAVQVGRCAKRRQEAERDDQAGLPGDREASVDFTRANLKMVRDQLSDVGNGATEQTHTGHMPEDCDVCSQHYHLRQRSSELPSCPACESTRVEYLPEEITGCRYLCIVCALTFNGSDKERDRYRRNQARMRRPKANR